MRSLFVGRWDPWPAQSGAQIRSAMIVEALAELGPVDLVVLRAGDRTDPPEVPIGVGVDRVHAASRGERSRRRRRDLARWMLDARLPPAIAALDPAPLRTEMRAWAHERYDLAWYERVETHALLAPVITAPTVVDVDELRDVSRSRRLRESWPEPRVRHDVGWLRHGFDHLVEHREATAWRRLQRRSAQHAASAVVCSTADADRLGTSNVVVVPNCVELPAADDVVRTPEPSVLFIGSMRYGPNTDAANLLLRDVLPAVRERVPDVRLRLVGDVGPTLQRLDGHDGVEVPGRVESTTPELTDAGVVAVPLRFGSGTRLKILEALAHGVPVVATSVAAEGLEVVDDDHLLIADSPAEFADRVVRVMRDPELAARLGRRGRTLVEHRYSMRVGVDAVKRAATEVGRG